MFELKEERTDWSPLMAAPAYLDRFRSLRPLIVAVAPPREELLGVCATDYELFTFCVFTPVIPVVRVLLEALGPLAVGLFPLLGFFTP